MTGEYGIVATVGEADRCLRLGAKCWIVDGSGGAGWDRFVVYGMSRSGRMIEKWCATERFTNFRAAWIPPAITSNKDERFSLYFAGTREEMELTAKNLNEFRATMRPLKPLGEEGV